MELYFFFSQAWILSGNWSEVDFLAGSVVSVLCLSVLFCRACPPASALVWTLIWFRMCCALPCALPASALVWTLICLMLHRGFSFFGCQHAFDFSSFHRVCGFLHIFDFSHVYFMQFCLVLNSVHTCVYHLFVFRSVSSMIV